MQDSLMYLPPQGFGVENRSLSGLPHAASQDRLVLLGIAEVTLIYSVNGDKLTWGVLGELDVPWGDNTALLYAQCETRWRYEWDLNTNTFTVTDDTGQETVQAGITTISGLGISWDILTSEQFHIYKEKNATITDTSLIGTRTDSGRPGELAAMHWMESDYLLGIQHAIFDFLLGYSPELPGTIPIDTSLSSDGSEDTISSILLAKTDELNFGNGYPLDLYPAEIPTSAERQARERIAYLQTYTYLMIGCFAAQLLSAGARTIYEPWMLYSFFQWLFQTSHSAAKEPIFDLSPWWG